MAQSLTVNGARIAYQRAGSGPALLLVHAGIADQRMWDPIWDLVTARFDVIRPDLRGFGDTPAPDGSYANWRDLAALLRGFGAAPVHAIGVSMGASAVLDLALAEPGAVDRLVLVAPGLAGWDWSDEIGRFWDEESQALERGDLDEAAWVNVRQWIDVRREAESVDPTVRQLVFEMQRRAFELSNPRADETGLQPPALGRLEEVRAPTLLVVGDADQPDVLAQARHAAARIPDARLEVVAGVAHLPPLEAPDRFVELVLPFLESQGAQPVRPRIRR
jgi:pimeloyl-ACP methyl ester carboxylesterase